jgi:hypothetical protein
MPDDDHIRLRNVQRPSVKAANANALTQALRIAHIRLRMLQLECEDIGIQLKEGWITPEQAMALSVEAGLDGLFPRRLDDA